jgi:hypothetical protein
VTDPAHPRSPEIEAHRRLGSEQGKLRHDVGIVRAYGEAHPDAWVGLRYENEPTVRIVALFTGDQVQVHENALRQLVEHPDQLELRWSPYPLTHLEGIKGDIDRLAAASQKGSFKQWGVGQGVVNVALKASKASLAAELSRRYGEAVDLTVGCFHYPDLSPLHLRIQSPGSELPPLPPELATVSLPEGLSVGSGDDLMSVLLVHNSTPDELVTETNGQVTARVLDPATGKMIGGFWGAQKMPLIPFRVPPHGLAELPLLVGTASFVEHLGYAVPPGEWLIDTTLVIRDHGSFRTRRLPISVVP